MQLSFEFKIHFFYDTRIEPKATIDTNVNKQQQKYLYGDILRFFFFLSHVLLRFVFSTIRDLLGFFLFFLEY